MLRGHLLFDDALLDEILTGRVTEGNDSSRKTMWVVLGLQLHLLLLVHLDCMQTILIQVRRLVRNLLL